MKPTGIIGTAALFLLLGTTAPVGAQQDKQNEAQGKADKQDKGKGHAQAGKQQQKDQGQKAAPQARREQQPRANRQEQANQQRQENRQQQENQQRQADQHQANRQQQANQQRQADQQQANRQQQANQEQQGNQQQLVNRQQQVRLSQGRQEQLITQQQRRVVEYRQNLDQQQPRAQQYAVTLQRQNRTASYRFQQSYVTRMRQQQLGFRRSYDYNNDPYFYTAASYRYSRGGSYYETNEYGANMLRQAINNGYSEGYFAGQADREDRWASDYRSSYAYQDANFGYDGYYGNQADYNYYFREGFNRGYQDGYYSRTQYGRYSNGSRSILGIFLSQILTLEPIRISVR